MIKNLVLNLVKKIKLLHANRVSKKVRSIENIANEIKRDLNNLPKAYNGFHAEDAIIYELFNKGFDINRKGFYVDVGAHRPIEFSLTYLFYQKGWRGINIDPLPGSKKLFDLIRPEDINLECAISEQEGVADLYLFENAQENTIDQKTSEEYKKFFARQLIGSKKVATKTLSQILDQYNKDNAIIDFINIDTEGMELGILKSNNWEKYTPKIIAVEQLEVATLEELANSDIYKFLKEKNYEFFCKTPCTVFYYNKKIYNIYGYLDQVKSSRI